MAASWGFINHRVREDMNMRTDEWVKEQTMRTLEEAMRD
jgi:hypothetical protein